MSEAGLKSSRFRKEREKSWRQLERIIKKIESGSTRSISDEDMIALPGLYRSALSSLSVARATSLDQSVVQYLESLSTRAYFILYGTRTSLAKRIGGFFVRDWPNAAQALWKETTASFIVIAIFAVISYILVMNNIDWFYSLMPGAMGEMRNPSASTEYLRETLFDGSSDDGLSSFSAFLMSHNSKVAIMAFALGFAFCLPTAYFMAFTGCMLGSFVALFADRGLGIEAAGWLSIHGTTEIFAIILAGAAGFHIGLSIAFPKDKPRLESASSAGRQGAVLMAGVVVMLIVAGLLEGFARQLVKSTSLRFTIGGGMLFLWCVYLYLPRNRLNIGSKS